MKARKREGEKMNNDKIVHIRKQDLYKRLKEMDNPQAYLLAEIDIQLKKLARIEILKVIISTEYSFLNKCVFLYELDYSKKEISLLLTTSEKVVSNYLKPYKKLKIRLRNTA